MTPIDNLEDRLARYDDTFKKASVDAYGNQLPDPGTYQAVFREVDFFESKAGYAFLKLVFEVTFDDEWRGHRIEKIYQLEFDDEAKAALKLGFLKKDLLTLGVDTQADDFSLTMVRPGSPVWDGVLDVPVEVAVVDSKKVDEKTGRPFRNAYLNARLGGPISQDVPNTVDPVAPVASVAGDDDIPF
jgi:hypothetical protein